MFAKIIKKWLFRYHFFCYCDIIKEHNDGGNTDGTMEQIYRRKLEKYN